MTAGHGSLEIFSYRVRKYIGTYLAALSGADAIVFGGGIGESTKLIRTMICEGMDWFGLKLDEHPNDATIDREGRISSDDSRLHAWVIPVEASEFQTRDWVFESPLGCHAPQQQVGSGRVAISVCAVRFRGDAPKCVRGGVDKLLKSPVSKTSVSP